MIRKYLTLILCALFILTVPVSAEENEAGGAEQTEAQEEVLRIGVSMWKTTDPAGAVCKRILDDTARSLGVKIIYGEHGRNSLKAAQTAGLLCDAGCSAIVYCSVSDDDLETALAACEERGVGFVETYRTLSSSASPELWQKAAQSDIFAGNVVAGTPPVPSLQGRTEQTEPAPLFYAFLLAYAQTQGRQDKTPDTFPFIETAAAVSPGQFSDQDIAELAELSPSELAERAAAG